MATVWRDKRAVAVLSTNADAETGSVTRKAPGGTKDVTIPQPIIACNCEGGGGGLFDGSAPCLLPCWSSLCEVVEIPLLVALPVSYDQCLHCFQGNSETRGAAKNHEAHQFLAGCSACLVCRQICETEGTCPVSVYGGCHSITPSFTCCLQVSWQEAKLFSVPEQQAPYTKGIHHSVELWMSSVLCSPVQSPMLCSLSSATGTAALNRYMCELYRCEM